jgi:phosphonate transport system substrate-binding protein
MVNSNNRNYLNSAKDNAPSPINNFIIQYWSSKIMFKYAVITIKLALLLAFTTSNAVAQNKVYSFGVLNQRSITLSAEYWNPILKYVSDKSGVTLQLKMARTAPDNSEMVGRSAFDFVYSNAIFSPENASPGYRVFARPSGNAIKGQIVVLEDSAPVVLKDLEGKDVGFPSRSAVVGYVVPMIALMKTGVQVNPLFAGNQEGIMAQLKSRRVIAAGVNSQVMLEYAQRESIKYRVLWSSESYLNMPIAAHPSVPQNIARAVRSAFLDMTKDPQGMKILQATAAVIQQAPPYGFVRAHDQEYSNYRKLYRHSQYKVLTK